MLWTLSTLLFVFLTTPSPSWSLTSSEIQDISTYAAAGACGGQLSITETGSNVVLGVNGMPAHVWGCVNPNKPISNPGTYTLPKTPSVDSNGPTCLPPGPIAVAKNGVFIFNPLTHLGTNAVEGKDAELFDCCGGHADQNGRYHYHQLPVTSAVCDKPLVDTSATQNPQFVGVDFDGYPIYSEWDSLDWAGVDECHGTTLPDGRYAYIASVTHFPYMMGCYKAAPADTGDRCTDAAKDKLCDCRWGTVTRAEGPWHRSKVTTAVRKKRKRSVKNLMEPRNIHSAEFVHRITKRSTLEECHSDACNADGVSYSNGACSGGGPGGGGPGNGMPPQTTTAKNDDSNNGKGLKVAKVNALLLLLCSLCLH